MAPKADYVSRADFEALVAENQKLKETVTELASNVEKLVAKKTKAKKTGSGSPGRPPSLTPQERFKKIKCATEKVLKSVIPEKHLMNAGSSKAFDRKTLAKKKVSFHHFTYKIFGKNIEFVVPLDKDGSPKEESLLKFMKIITLYANEAVFTAAMNELRTKYSAQISKLDEKYVFVQSSAAESEAESEEESEAESEELDEENI